MNRSILIVICDFLLVSLLAFSTVDISKVSQGGTPQLNLSAPATNVSNGRQDLGDVMRLALEEERRNHEQLAEELTRARETVTQQAQQIQSVQNQLQGKEQLAAQLAEKETTLEGQIAAAQTNLASLNQQLQATAAESVITREQRAAMEVEARQQAEKAATLAQQLSQLQKTNQSLQTDQQALRNQLLLSEASNHSAVVQITQLQDEVEAQRRENGQLADGVNILAAKSSELAHELHDNLQLAPNLIFADITTNRVLASFAGLKSGFFGTESSRGRQTKLILTTDGTNTFALCHVHDTPLTLWNPGTQWEELSGTLTHGAGTFPIQSISFCFLDPRLVVIPVPQTEMSAMGCKVYRLSKDPFKFQDAVVVGTREDYYGECKFQMDVSTPQYLKMDHNSLKGLFGKFNPSSGDLVLSKSGELLGVMANDNYCAVIRNFQPLATFQLGPASRNQPTAQTLATLYTVVSGLPFKLQ